MLPEAIFPPRIYFGLVASCYLHSHCNLGVVSPRRDGNVCGEEPPPALFELLEDPSLPAPWFPRALEALGGEGRACPFKSTPAKGVRANSSLVLICLNRTDGDLCKFVFTSFFAIFFFFKAPSCWPSCCLTTHIHRGEQSSLPACWCWWLLLTWPLCDQFSVTVL